MKWIIYIGIPHFMLTAICEAGATYEAAEAVRAGSEEISTLGVAFHYLANILSQPASSTLIRVMPEDSIMFWPILFMNSILWGFVISVFWGKFRREEGID